MCSGVLVCSGISRSKIVKTDIDFIKLFTKISFIKGVHSLLNAQHGNLTPKHIHLKFGPKNQAVN